MISQSSRRKYQIRYRLPVGNSASKIDIFCITIILVSDLVKEGCQVPVGI